MNILDFFLFAALAYFVWFVVTFLINFGVEYYKLRKQQSVVMDWVFPIHVKYTPEPEQYFAWDIEDVFLGQSNNYDDLLTNIRKRWNIPEDKLVIKSTEEM